MAGPLYNTPAFAATLTPRGIDVCLTRESGVSHAASLSFKNSIGRLLDHRSWGFAERLLAKWTSDPIGGIAQANLQGGELMTQFTYTIYSPFQTTSARQS
jgi:hypothetical protein